MIMIKNLTEQHYQFMADVVNEACEQHENPKEKFEGYPFTIYDAMESDEIGVHNMMVKIMLHEDELLESGDPDYNSERDNIASEIFDIVYRITSENNKYFTEMPKQHPKSDEYYTENVRNNLPPWSDDFTKKHMPHILQEHTFITNRINYLLNEYKDRLEVHFNRKKKEFKKATEKLQERFLAGAKLDKFQEEIIQTLRIFDKKDLFPISMTERDIRRAIQDAYKDATKISSRQPRPTDRDYTNAGEKATGAILYQGKARDMTIHFWFCFEDNSIETAYPIDPNKTKRDQEQAEYSKTLNEMHEYRQHPKSDEYYTESPIFTETISIPLDDFFEDMDVLEIGIETGWFYEYAEMLSEVPMVDVSYRGNKHRVSIHDMHKDKPIDEQRRIARYAIRWKMKIAKKASGLSEQELKKPLEPQEVQEMEAYRKEIKAEGIQVPRGEIVNKVDVTIRGFNAHALDRLSNREISIDAAQEWVDSSIIMMKQYQNQAHLYISFDGSVAIEVINGEVKTIYPSTSFGNASRRLMQKALSIIKNRK
jgi:hypothetical protein